MSFIACILFAARSESVRQPAPAMLMLPLGASIACAGRIHPPLRTTHERLTAQKLVVPSIQGDWCFQRARMVARFDKHVWARRREER